MTPRPAGRAPADSCRTCRHFRNAAAFLEDQVAGLASMSSAYADARLDDGLCLRHDVHLQATASCREHAPAA